MCKITTKGNLACSYCYCMSFPKLLPRVVHKKQCTKTWRLQYVLVRRTSWHEPKKIKSITICNAKTVCSCRLLSKQIWATFNVWLHIQKSHKILRQLNVWKTNAYVNQAGKMRESKTHSLVTAVHIVDICHFHALLRDQVAVSPHVIQTVYYASLVNI